MGQLRSPAAWLLGSQFSPPSIGQDAGEFRLTLSVARHLTITGKTDPRRPGQFRTPIAMWEERRRSEPLRHCLHDGLEWLPQHSVLHQSL